MKAPTFFDLQQQVSQAEAALKAAKPGSETIPALREAVRGAREAARVFAYKAKPSLSRNGHALRP
jgi:hypothetical protein